MLTQHPEPDSYKNCPNPLDGLKNKPKIKI